MLQGPKAAGILALTNIDGYEPPAAADEAKAKPAGNAKAGSKAKAKAKPKAVSAKPYAPSAVQAAEKYIMSLSRDITRAARLILQLEGSTWGQGVRQSMLEHKAGLAHHQNVLQTLVADPSSTEQAVANAIQACNAAVQTFHADAMRATRILEPTGKAKAKGTAKANAKSAE